MQQSKFFKTCNTSMKLKYNKLNSNLKSQELLFFNYLKNQINCVIKLFFVIFTVLTDCSNANKNFKNVEKLWGWKNVLYNLYNSMCKAYLI